MWCGLRALCARALRQAQKKVYSIFQDGAQLKQFEIDAGPECKDRQVPTGFYKAAIGRRHVSAPHGVYANPVLSPANLSNDTPGDRGERSRSYVVTF